MLTRIHVNQHIIRENRKEGQMLPPLTVKNYKVNTKAFTAKILDEHGKEVARVVYRPHKPLPCGATCWVETEQTVEVE